MGSEEHGVARQHVVDRDDERQIVTIDDGDAPDASFAKQRETLVSLQRHQCRADAFTNGPSDRLIGRTLHGASSKIVDTYCGTYGMVSGLSSTARCRHGLPADDPLADDAV
jgi:hypothetical protein